MNPCFDSRCRNGICMGHCGGKEMDHMTDSLLYLYGNQDLTLKSKIELLEMDIKDLHLLLQHRTKMMWAAWFGWVITAILFMLYSMGVL